MPRRRNSEDLRGRTRVMSRRTVIEATWASRDMDMAAVAGWADDGSWSPVRNQATRALRRPEALSGRSRSRQPPPQFEGRQTGSRAPAAGSIDARAAGGGHGRRGARRKLS